MDKFTIVKKGYDRDEVDAHIKRLEDTLDKQRERIDSLLSDAEKSEAELKAFKQKQGLIAKAIMGAAEKAEQIENLTRQKYAGDMAHLKAFHERWIVYYNKLIARYPLDEELLSLNTFNESMTKILTGEAPLGQQMSEAETQFKRENERLKKRRGGYIRLGDDDDDEDVFNPEDSIRALLRRQAEDEQKRKARKSEAPSEPSAAKRKKKAAEQSAASADEAFDCDEESGGFSYDEALNPTQDLSEILRDLGVFDIK